MYEARAICGFKITAVLLLFKNCSAPGNLAKKTTLLVPWLPFAFTAKPAKSREAESYHNVCVWHHQIIHSPRQRKKKSSGKHFFCFPHHAVWGTDALDPCLYCSGCLWIYWKHPNSRESCFLRNNKEREPRQINLMNERIINNGII